MIKLSLGFQAGVIALSAAACGATQQSQPTSQTAAATAPTTQPAPSAGEVAHHATLANNRIEIDQNVDFEENSDHLVASSSAILDHVAALLQTHPEIRMMRIEGNTDNLGTPEHNQQLSVERAAAVAQYLRTHGVSIRLETIGHGATHALCTEDTEGCRGRNRRVEFIVVAGGVGGA